MMFNTLLIANRGEIACRIIKTAQRLGIQCIAVYSDADQNSLHIRMADRAYRIGGFEAKNSYLNIDAIIHVAKQAGVEAIHPGYGFLSENPQFAEACAAAGIVFVGPSIASMQAMASKQLSKQLLSTTTVPLTPGYHGLNQSDDDLLKEALLIGFPILLKAANGGGGKGMREVRSQSEFQSALHSARREALACFGDEIMIIEKYIEKPRHVEIQIMADNFGQVVHLFERDCSIQRRHQKIIEEAPAPGLSERIRSELALAAMNVAKAIDYRGAGTVEFLVDPMGRFYFMEMNTRLQVEHPVTEMITGLDLVEWQLRIAANEPLPEPQENIRSHGHAIECRVYAEDPLNQFLPSTGNISLLKEPQNDGIRIDTGITLHSEITQYYDPMIAKLIAFGSTREEAIQRLTQAIKQYWIGGVKTNLPLLGAIIAHPQFKASELSTDFLTTQVLEIPTLTPDWVILMTACYDYLQLNHPYQSPLQWDTFAWQMHLKSQWTTHYLIQNDQHTVHITPLSPHTLQIHYNNHLFTLSIRQHHHELYMNDGTQIRHAMIDVQDDIFTLYSEEGTWSIRQFGWQQANLQLETLNHQLTAPMPATIIAVLKKKGDRVQTGDPLLVLEAMKMEHTILSPNDGIIAEVFYDLGAQVTEGAELVELLPMVQKQS